MTHIFSKTFELTLEVVLHVNRAVRIFCSSIFLMARNTITIKQWISMQSESHKATFLECNTLQISANELINKIINILDDFNVFHSSYVNRATFDYESFISKLEELQSSFEVTCEKFNKLCQELSEKSTDILENKMHFWKCKLWETKIKLSYYLQELIFDIASLFIYYGEQILILTFGISKHYNALLSLEAKYNLSNMTIVSSNTCPYILHPPRKVSITKLLQLLAQRRAEICSHKLIDCLLDSYSVHEVHDDDSKSENSSLEIYRALTRHMSPPPTEDISDEPVLTKSTDESNHFLNLTKLIEYEEKNVIEILNASLKICPNMLGHDGIKKSKNGGSAVVNPKAQEKVIKYYQEILWGEVGNYLEHIILWWGPSPLASRPPYLSQHLREWISQFVPVAKIPAYISTTLSNLADALGVHVTSTNWDKKFRLALVASKSVKNLETGQYFCDMLQDLVMLSNQFEVTADWIVGAPLDELPLVEQIPVLHRLDHSVHTTRLWATNESKKMANNWEVKLFFMITHCDIVNCLAQLSNIRLVDHSLEIEGNRLAVHVEVCSKMREKLVSEVKINIQKLKTTSEECIKCLASVCTTISLANLQMIFPPQSYWNKSGRHYPTVHSTYVYKYFDQILTPVLFASEDALICNMILKLMCEAWLDNIYINKIKFSESGALQLLTDFASVTNWILDCSIINEHVKNKMLKNEVLRRCEGVGKLLLRNPGEKIKMNKENGKKEDIENSPKSTTTELMPAEMYVPNQEQWLELRANKRKLFMLSPLCCTK